MLEKYTYINHTCLDGDIDQKIKSLFVANNQQKRYEHISSVAKRIDAIAIQYGLDREKCHLAAILHDISTLIKWEDMLPLAKELGWQMCDAELSHSFLLHQRISEVIAREDFEITDDDVLKAIAFHTSLCEYASQYQMALFIADKLDWSVGGYPPYYEEMEAALSSSLEDACYAYVKYTEGDGKINAIHTDWARAVKWLKNQMGE